MVEIISLSIGAAHILKQLHLLFALNPLCNHTDAHNIGHAGDCLQDSHALTHAFVVHVQKFHINFQDIYIHIFKHVKGGVTAAKIIHQHGKALSLIHISTALITVAVVLTAFFLIFGRRILLMFGASGNTIEYGWAYMQIYSLGTIFVQLALGLNAFINAQGYAKTGMYTVLIGAICNIILDPILMFVFHMGVRGAALATIISQGISAAWVVLFLISNKSYLKIRTCFMRPKREILMPAIALGAAPFVMQFTESILNICFNTSLLKYGGDVAVGAMTIMGSVMQFSLPVSYTHLFRPHNKYS